MTKNLNNVKTQIDLLYFTLIAYIDSLFSKEYRIFSYGKPLKITNKEQVIRFVPQMISILEKVIKLKKEIRQNFRQDNKFLIELKKIIDN